MKCENQKREVQILGNHLYLVKGFVRWGLYDLRNNFLTIIDNQSGEFLSTLAKLNINAQKKSEFLIKKASYLWSKIQEIGINERIFLKDTSFIYEKRMNLIWIEVTDFCNQNCIHCYKENDFKKKSWMTTAMANTIAKEAKCLNFIKLQIVGGEPFTNPDIWEIIEFIHELDFQELEVFTNLTLLTFKDLNRIKEMGIHIATSLLGHNAEIHEKCTQTPGSYAIWFRNIKQIQALKIPYRIGVVRMKQNEGHMDKIRRFLINEGIISEREPFDPDDVRPSGRGCNTDIIPSQSLATDKNFLNVTPQFFHRVRSSNPCWYGEVMVSTDGSVYPCVFSRNISVGNIKKESLVAIIERLKNSYWKITLDKVEKCKDCELRYACMDCRPLSISSGGGLYGAPLRCNYDPYN